MLITDIPIGTMEGTITSLGDYAGKVVLVVNVASRCGLTPQYAKLEALQRTYGERGFTVLGFPSNQFMQELSSNEAIKDFCSTTYAVTFPVFDRVRVNGRHEHPLYTELKKTKDAHGKAGRIQWNFEKFLVLPSGDVKRFRPKTEPDDPSIIDAIEANLPV
jgi:glutathione peroxidase